MKKPFLAALALSFTLPLLAQTPEPAPPTPAPEPTPAPQTPAPPPPPPEKPKSSMAHRWFFGGGVGASFGSVDYVEIAPLVGFRVIPRLDVGIQPFYRWTDYGAETSNDYGASLFARVRVIGGFFLEADYQYNSYEYPDGFGGTTRDTYDGFLAGAGYSVPVGRNVGFYVSALYDFSYDSNAVFQPYDSPVRFQVGVSVGF